MKQTIKLTESELRNMISESVKRILNEADSFKQVDNLNDYVASNGLQMRQASKFQRINARPAQEGERITTIASDGVGETTNVAEQGDWVVNNVSNPDNQWIIDGKTFAKKYVPVNGQQGVYMPKGGPMNAAQINEPISFIAPWGETMNIDKGGYILQDPTNPNDIYGISGKDFDNTYKFNENKTTYNSNILEYKHYKTIRNMKQTIRLNESELKRMITESVKRALFEAEQWQQGSDYMPAGWAKEYGYEKNGQGVERTNPSPNRRSYSLRNTNNGRNNHTRINASKGGGVNNMSHMNFGNGGMDSGQLNSIIDELSQYIGATPEEIKAQLGIK